MSVFLSLAGTAQAQYKARVLENFSPWPILDNRLPYSAYGVAGSGGAGDPVWFCGENNMLMKKDGSTWYNYSGGHYGTCTDPLYDVAVNFDDPDNVISVGYDMRAITFDGGDNWEHLCFFGDTERCIHYCTYEHYFVRGRDNGAMCFGGVSNPPFGDWWTCGNAGGNRINDITTVLDWSTSDTNVIAVCQNGSIYYVEDYTWNSIAQQATISPSTSSPFTGVTSSWLGDDCVAVTLGGDVYYSTDAGKNWSKSGYWFGGALRDVSIRSGVVYIVGDNGLAAYASLSNLNSWQQVNTGITEDLFAISEDIEYHFLQVGEKFPLFSPIGSLDQSCSTDSPVCPEMRIGTDPNTQDLLLRYTPSGSGEIRLSIFDISGRMVQESLLSGNPGSEMTVSITSRLSAGNAPTGVYLCRLSEGNSAVTGRFVYSR